MDKLLNNNHLVIVDVGASGGIDPRWSKTTECYTDLSLMLAISKLAVEFCE